MQDLDYENEVELLYAVVTLPTGSEDTRALLCFMDDRTGRITKEVPLPTWKPVSVLLFSVTTQLGVIILV